MGEYTFKHYRADPSSDPTRPQPGRRIQMWDVPAASDTEAIVAANSLSGDLVDGTDFAVLFKGTDEIIYVWDVRGR